MNQKQVVFDFVRNHPGCTRKRVISGLSMPNASTILSQPVKRKMLESRDLLVHGRNVDAFHTAIIDYKLLPMPAKLQQKSATSDKPPVKLPTLSCGIGSRYQETPDLRVPTTEEKVRAMTLSEVLDLRDTINRLLAD